MDADVLNQLKNETGVTMVEFYATWCPHCQKMMPVMEDVKAQVQDSVTVYQFDIDKYQELADELGVKSIPTFIVYDNGEEMWRHTGEMAEDTLLAILDDTLN